MSRKKNVQEEIMGETKYCACGHGGVDQGKISALLGSEATCLKCGLPVKPPWWRLEIDRLRAANAELLAACERFLACHQSELDAVKLSTGKEPGECLCGACVEARSAVANAKKGA